MKGATLTRESLAVKNLQPDQRLELLTFLVGQADREQ
jgi:hypothetical protein